MTAATRSDLACLNLKAGELVEVRTQREILSTLDERGRLQGLPFMPEMLQYCGQRFRVWKRADKTCDPAHDPWTIRRLKDVVHLEGSRCDGRGHDGCEAGCLLFWHEAWLRRSSIDTLETEGAQNCDKQYAGQQSGFCTVDSILASSQKVGLDGNVVYSCQATDLQDFTSPMAWWDPRQYVRDLRSRNLRTGLSRGSISERVLEFTLSLLEIVRAFILSMFKEHRLLSYPATYGALEKTSVEALNLQAGELVRVRTKEEILATLDKRSRNRGLSFDGEMLRYCDGIYRVVKRVDRIVDERTGKMLHMKNPCIVLEGVYCRSDYHRLCPRAILHYWRENWLKRIASVPESGQGCEIDANSKNCVEAIR